MFSRNEMDEIYKLSGELILDWSGVETLWYLIFTTLLPNTDRAAIDAIYYSFETDSNRRTLLIAVADTVFKPDPKRDKPHPTRAELGRLLARTNDLAGMRNAVAHGSISPSIGAIKFSPGNNVKKPNKLAGKKLTAELKSAIQGVEKLGSDLKDFLISGMPLEQRYMHRDLIAALEKSGLQVPSWAIPRPSPKAVAPDDL